MVGLLSEESKRDASRAKHALQILADASGGSASFPKELTDVEKVTLQIASEIRNQYIIEYNPVNQNFDGSFRPVRVAVNAAGKPTVRTRTGYYATPDAPKKSGQQATSTSPR
jgi:VWFA-related protein